MSKSLFAVALRLLSRKNYSSKELSEKLLLFCKNKEEIKSVIESLKEKKIISDNLFSDRLVEKLLLNYGSKFIERKLYSCGIDPDIINSYMFSIRQTDFERAVLLCDRKFKNHLSDDKLYSKKARFLTSHGFPSDVVYKILRFDMDD
ncbi:regulatory protein [Candidatus Kinetoplastibacterium desouzaii TCC079E]|uniref:Regulatory protein RecX n=1 Tax=Candidatus Kinetoplastidibacterium desouzai TCC079E TaxID=1208919 RepID=M1L1Y8_9PROT|nr:regulatory protein RecX [Candidatus Kinetoplastibacterium desouzaii]AGF46763.1 regulatory protein [Candidatus Kinetoplastibacterium desouzaii TCC079E]